LVEAMEHLGRVVVQDPGVILARDEEHGDAVGIRLDEAPGRIRGAGTRDGEQDAGLPGSAGIAVRHHRARLLVAHRDVPHAIPLLVEGAVKGGKLIARLPEHRGHALRAQAIQE
jgi:hypothetical protein